MDVGVLLADRAEGSLGAGIAQGIDVCGRYVVIVGGLPIAEPDWVVPTLSCGAGLGWAGLGSIMGASLPADCQWRRNVGPLGRSKTVPPGG